MVSWDPEPVGEIAVEWARRRGLDVALDLGMGNRDIWAGIVGEDIAANGEPVACHAGVLYLAARDSLAATRLRYVSEAIRAVCNERLGRDLIHVVVVREAGRGWGSPTGAW